MKKTVALLVHPEIGNDMMNLQNCHNDSDELKDLVIDEIQEEFVFNNDSVNYLKSKKILMLPNQEVFAKIKKRREKNNDLSSLSYYNIYFPYQENDNQEEVSLTIKIPKSIHTCLKKIAYFSGKSMKECIVSAIAHENFELNNFLLEEEFDIDPGWYDIMCGDEDYFDMKIR